MAVTKGKWARRSEGEWRLLLAKFGGSGLGVAAFCRNEGISSANFYRWRNMLGGVVDQVVGDDHAGMPAFVDVGELHAATQPMPRLDLRLELGGGLVLHLVRG